MAYDTALAKRVGALLRRRKNITQKEMFGGACFLVNGNMCCGVERDKLVVRVGVESYEQLLQKRHVKPMDFTGKPLRGFIYVLPAGLKRRESLKAWLDWGLQYVGSLPAKRS